MTIPPESIQVGKCYLARSLRSPRIRRVVEIMSDGRILYEQHTPTTGWHAAVQDRRSFASMLEREIPCNWTPEGES